MTDFIRRVSYKINHFLRYEWEIIEIQGASFKLAWALLLLAPGNTFRAVQGYTAISLEVYWGWGLLIIGSVHMYSIFSRRKYKLFRTIMTFIGFSFWVFSGFLIYFQSHTLSLPIMFWLIALFLFLNFLRLSLPEETIPPPATYLGN